MSEQQLARRVSGGLDASANDLAYFDDVQQGLAAELAAMQQPPAIPVHALPDKSYLEATVLPLLLHGLEVVATERPADPIEYLAAYLLSNNPQRDAALPTPPAEHPMLMGCLPPVSQGDVGNGANPNGAATSSE